MGGDDARARDVGHAGVDALPGGGAGVDVVSVGVDTRRVFERVERVILDDLAGGADASGASRCLTLDVRLGSSLDAAELAAIVHLALVREGHRVEAITASPDPWPERWDAPVVRPCSRCGELTQLEDLAGLALCGPCMVNPNKEAI